MNDLFWSKVDKTETCWLWTRATNNGYGVIGIDKKVYLAHHIAYQELVGPIPEGLTLDHLCRVRNCVNPDHLEAVSMQVNVLRGIGPTARHAVKTHCAQGHPFDAENTYIRKTGRACRKCMYAWSAAAASRNRGRRLSK